MALDTVSLEDNPFLGHPSKRLPAPKFTSNLNKLRRHSFFSRPTIIHTEQNTLLMFKQHFKVRFPLFSLHSVLGGFPSGIAEFQLICPHCNSGPLETKDMS